MQEVIYTENCTGCRSCEIACAYHHRKIFSRKITSIEVRRTEGEGEFGIVLYRQPENGHIACDCADGDEFCLKYCPEVACDELRSIIRARFSQ